MINGIISTLRGFTFNGKHNKDFSVVMHNKSIQPPPKKKIKESVPFMNGSYDFSTIGNNGEIIYDERSITVVIGIPATSKDELFRYYSKVLEWLVDVGQSKLIFDDHNMFYYVAEVVEVSTFEEVMNFGRLTIKFTAEPFKASIDYISDDIWDTFNFEEDYLQNLNFDVINTKTIDIYNSGRITTPTFNTTSTMQITVDGLTYNLTVGDNTFYDFKLQNGKTQVVINGTGHLTILFRKELI